MKRKILIGGALSLLMLCGVLAGCSGSGTQTEVSSSAAVAAYEKGTLTETEYTSQWIGMKYTLPEGMSMMDEEYLQSSSAGNVQMEMQALKNDTSGDNIVLLTEDISASGDMSEADYIEVSKTQMSALGSDVTFGEVSTRTIAGQEFYELPYNLTMEISGVSMNMDQSFLCRKQGDRMICITMTYGSEEGMNDLLSGFSQI